MKEAFGAGARNGYPTMQCAKIGYGTEALALAAAKTFNEHEVQRSYRCPTCLQWHLTSREAVDGPVREDMLLVLPGGGRQLPVEVVVRRLADGRLVGLSLRPRGLRSFVALSGRHLPALKAALDELLRET